VILFATGFALYSIAEGEGAKRMDEVFGEDQHGLMIAVYVSLQVMNAVITILNTGLILFHIRIHANGISTYDFILGRRAVKAR
jgi:hypothetical protein